MKEPKYIDQEEEPHTLQGEIMTSHESKFLQNPTELKNYKRQVRKKERKLLNFYTRKFKIPPDSRMARDFEMLGSTDCLPGIVRKKNVLLSDPMDKKVDISTDIEEIQRRVEE